jgi:hypothetical protein
MRVWVNPRNSNDVPMFSGQTRVPQMVLWRPFGERELPDGKRLVNRSSNENFG